jgi:Zn-finger nucleic acid-binding protein
MHCPVCRQEMKPLKIGDVQVDECRRCKGIWFDKGELKEVKDEVDPDLRFLDIKMLSRKAVFNINKEPLECPRCRKVSMRRIHFQEPDIDITLCPACEGVWLNAGDFKKILDALRDEAASRSLSDYVKTSLKEGSEIFTNPGRFISEWRDLKAVLRMLRYRIFVENQKLRSILVGIQKSLPL